MPSRVNDDHDMPLNWVEMAGGSGVIWIWVSGKGKYFCLGGWIRNSPDFVQEIWFHAQGHLVVKGVEFG
jgi:hypothetical protein